jgi:small-conductance mechanosensitive channel
LPKKFQAAGSDFSKPGGGAEICLPLVFAGTMLSICGYSQEIRARREIMNAAADGAHLGRMVSQAPDYFFHQVLAWSMAAQVAVVVLACLLAYYATEHLRAWFGHQQPRCETIPEACLDLTRIMTFTKVIGPFLAFVLIWIIYRMAEHFHWSRDGLYTGAILMVALSMIRFLTASMTNRFWARILVIAIWLWAALFIFHLIVPWQRFLGHIYFDIGRVHLSLLILSRACFILLILYWLSRNLLVIWQFWLTANSNLGPAVQVLLYKLGGILLFAASCVIVLDYLGIGLTVFALFSGALGLGLGFGLQKIFANLVSGFIILADKSIKPGDVIQVGSKYGWIKFLGSRYTSVVTRNGTEHLIPNENLVTSEVINWSYSNNLVRIDLPVGVAYGADLEKARDLMLEIAAGAPRVLKQPNPACLLTGFGDSTINLELRLWINDPQNGIGAIRSEILWGVWRKFKEHGIELPFPQRDLHLKTLPEIRVQTGPATGRSKKDV